MKILHTLALTCLTTCALADTTLTYKNNADNVSMKMQFADDMMRATTMGDDTGNMIYNAKNKTFTILIPQEKQYYVMDEKTIESLTDISAMVEKMMEKQLAQVPEEQREMMRNMIAGAMKSQIPKQLPMPEYTLTRKTDSFNGFDCQIVLKKSGKNKSEFCVADYSELGMSSSEYNVIATFQKTIEKLAKQFGTDQSMNFMELGTFIPVNYQQDKQSGTLTDVSHEEIDSSVFAIPVDYKEIELPFADLQ
ncbi:MAG: DUF4412 domain-containing protein [Marinicellaceae bacterium]